MQKHFVVAIDGPAGSGKSTSAKGVARALKVVHLDTGAMYRAVTLAALEKGIKADEAEKLGALSKDLSIRFERDPDGTQRIFLGHRDVSREIRSAEVSRSVSAYCALPAVREVMVEKQREIAARGSLVAEGRDIGTVVFPEAKFKFFFTASIEERARRRMKDFEKMGEKPLLEEVMRDIAERDRADSTREASPLKKAADAEEIDTTGMSLEDQISLIVRKVSQGLYQ